MSAIGAQPVGEQAAGGAGAADDVVVASVAHGQRTAGGEHREQLHQAVRHHLDREGGQQQAHQPRHDVDAGAADDAGDAAGQAERDPDRQADDDAVADQDRDLPPVARLLGVDDHRRDRRRAGEQRDRQRHDRDRVAGVDLVAAFGEVAGAAFGRLRVEHLQRRQQQQHAAADLERGERDAEELDDAQPGDGADGDDDEGADRGDADRAAPLLAAEAFGEMDEERQHADRIDDRQQGDAAASGCPWAKVARRQADERGAALSSSASVRR